MSSFDLHFVNYLQDDIPVDRIMQKKTLQQA